MKLHQLRYIWEVAHHDLNVTAAATDLYTSQPGISRQIRLLEDELGVEIFARSGKHLTRVTAAGQIILDKVGHILREVDSIKAVAEEYRNETRGTLSIATTHTQARYALPDILPALRERYPEVSLNMRQGNTEQIGELASSGVVDFAIAPEVMDRYGDLVMMPCYRWNRCVVVPRDHPLADRRTLRFEDLEAHPIVTYDAGFRERLPLARDDIDEDESTFNIALSAVDTDVIKTYVRLGFGIGVIARMAYDQDMDRDLVAIDASNLFRPSTTYIGCRKGTFMRQFMLDFVGLFAPHLTAEVIRQALAEPNVVQRAALFEDMELPER
ncbi:MAG: HTH-type transcriptional regulator CysB [Gammaproteobacteria bacterium]|nr:HTH-type transcriptional regulator CysB [Gammaproteobacteria bacterium]